MNWLPRLPWLPWLLGAFVLSLDQASKYYANSYLKPINFFSPFPYEGVPIFKNFFGIDFSLNLATNSGAAWSLFQDYPYSLLCVRVILIIWLLSYTWRLPMNSYLKIPLALIIGGAIGNVVDIFHYGHVIDMFHFVFWGYDYPIFNVADSVICIGVFVSLILSFFIAQHDSCSKPS